MTDAETRNIGSCIAKRKRKVILKTKIEKRSSTIYDFDNDDDDSISLRYWETWVSMCDSLQDSCGSTTEHVKIFDTVGRTES